MIQMKEVTYYLADDGKQFEDEYDCKAYEFGLNVQKKKKEFVLLDEAKRPLNPIDPDSYENVWYIFLKNWESAEALCEIWGNDVIDVWCPNFLNHSHVDPGLYTREEYDNDEWYHVGDRIKEMEEMADEAMFEVNRWLNSRVSGTPEKV